MAVRGQDRQVGAQGGHRAVEAEQGQEQHQRLVLHQRQPEVRGYCSQALSWTPTAGAIQMIISTMSALTRARRIMMRGAGRCFTVVPSSGSEVDRIAEQRAGHANPAA